MTERAGAHDRPGRVWWLVVIGLVGSCAQGPQPPDPSTLPSLDAEVRALVDELVANVAADRSSGLRWGQLGMAFEANGLQAQAEHAYAMATDLAPSEPRWRYRLALSRARRGDLDQALGDLERVSAQDPSYAPARWRQGLWRLDRGDVRGAETAFEAAIQVAPRDPAGPIGLALVHLSRREDAQAAASLERLVQNFPGDRYAHHLLGTAYARLGREDEARLALAIGMKSEPVWSDPWSDEVGQYRRGFAAMLKEATGLGVERRFSEAIALLAKLTRQRPGDIDLQVYLGGMYASAGRVDEAAAVLEPVLAANPAQFDALMHLASGYLFAGALDKAADFASRALVLRPSSAAAAKLRGVVHWQQGHLREAAVAFAASTDADPRDPMPHLWTGMILGQQGRYLEARQRFEAAVAKDPLLGDALIGLADTWAATGNFDRARTVLGRAERAEPGNPHLAAARDRIDTAAKRLR